MQEESPPNLLNEIETRQNEVLRLLDELENRLHATLKESQLQIASETQSDSRKAA
jgi:hypothetical protein